MFEQEHNNLVRKIAERVEENNRLLRKLLSYQRLHRAWFLARWIVIIAAALGAYYYLQPLIGQFTQNLEESKGLISGFTF